MAIFNRWIFNSRVFNTGVIPKVFPLILQYDQGGISYSRTFETLVVKGMSEPDKLKKVGIIHDLLSGETQEQIQGFQKRIKIGFRPPFVPTTTRFLTKWFLATRKRILYGTLLSEGVTDETLVSSWLYDLEYGRSFEVDFYDEHVYRRWEDTGAIAETLMYFKRDVKIEGTEASPETFTTNSGKLALMQNGLPFPSFSDSTHDFLVALNAEKNCQATFAVVKGSVSVVTGNLTFQAFASDYGSPAGDGFFWVAIAIFLQEK